MGKEYRDVVNRPNVADRIGGTLSGVAKSNPAITQQQRNGNAFLAGAGAGAQGVGDGIRSAKLEKYEGYAKELAIMDAQLKIQMGKNEMIKQTYTQFASNYFHDIKRTDKAYGDGDYDAMNRLLPNMLAGLKKINPDMAAQLGSFSHTYDNNAYFTTPDGKSQGVNIKDLFAQTLGSMDEERQQEFPNLLSSVSSDKFAAARAADRAKIEKDEAHTRNMDAQSALYGAQAEKSYIEAGKIGQEMNAPKAKYDKETLSAIKKDNLKKIEESNLTIATNKKTIGAYSDIAKNIHAEVQNGKLSAAGSSIVKKTLRTWNSFAGDDDAAKAIQLSQMPLFGELKQIFGARITDVDLVTFMTMLPNLEQNPTVALKEIDKRVSGFQKDNKRLSAHVKTIENEFNFEEPFYGQRVMESLDKQQGDIADMVKVTDPDSGEQMLIPASNVDAARTRGLVIDE